MRPEMLTQVQSLMRLRSAGRVQRGGGTVGSWGVVLCLWGVLLLHASRQAGLVVVLVCLFWRSSFKVTWGWCWLWRSGYGATEGGGTMARMGIRSTFGVVRDTGGSIRCSSGCGRGVGNCSLVHELLPNLHGEFKRGKAWAAAFIADIIR
eukprot:1157630-Pelagomonas_calceolata.AAC.2